MRTKYIPVVLLTLFAASYFLIADSFSDSEDEMESIDTEQLQEVNQEEDEMQIEEVQEVEEAEIPHDRD